MADGGLPLEAVPPDIFYKCHPNQKNSTVYCALCDSVWHKSDFNRKKGVKYVTSVLVICDEHPDIDLTSIRDNTGDTRVILLDLKSKLKSKERECNNSYTCFSQLKAQYEALQIKYNNLLLNKDELSMDITMNPDDENALKTEVILLRELNAELKSKNSLLEELLKKEKESPKTNKKTYAEAIHSQPIIEQPKMIPKIIVKKKDKKDTSNIKEKVLYYLTKARAVQTKNIDTREKDTIKISCVSQESAKAAKKTLGFKLGHIYNVEEEELKKPVIKIIGFNNYFNLDQKSLETDINTRNFANLQEKGKILHVSNNEKKEKSTIIMEVSATLHKYIKENKSKLYVGHQNCRVFDVVNIKPCFKCARLEHNPFKCKNNPICMICAGTHLTKFCSSTNTECCANCKFSNTKYGTSYNINHMATDSENCDILKSKIKKVIISTDYLVKPYIPRYLGKTGNFNNNEQEPTTKSNTTPRLRWNSEESLASTRTRKSSIDET